MNREQLNKRFEGRKRPADFEDSIMAENDPVELTREQIVKEFHILNGGHWHELSVVIPNTVCSCGKVWYHWVEIDSLHDHLLLNPLYQHPEEVLKVMMGRKDWWQFRIKVLYEGSGLVCNIVDNILTYITERDKLLIAAHKWCKEHKEAV